VLFSDFTDPTSAELMIENVGRLVERHRDVRGHGRCRACRDRRRAARDMQAVAMAVTATALARQRALVLQRLRHLGARGGSAARPDRVRLLDAYLAVKRQGSIG
jgi:hypothetical protein